MIPASDHRAIGSPGPGTVRSDSDRDRDPKARIQAPGTIEYDIAGPGRGPGKLVRRGGHG
eukprot:36665-Hanusia_phi.AAC.1